MEEGCYFFPKFEGITSRVDSLEEQETDYRERWIC